VAAIERELKDIWTNVCRVTHLAQVIPPPGATLQAPLIGTITLDSAPARFTVKLRAGQVPGDFAKRIDRIAAAFRVPAVEVVPITADNQWISVRLMEPYWIEWPDEYVVEPASLEEPRPAIADVPAREAAGGPRSLGRGRHRATKQLVGSEPSGEPAPTTAFGSVLRFLGEFWRLPESDGAPR
jgi:hypothetical protein